jgi:hypothetical protein
MGRCGRQRSGIQIASEFVERTWIVDECLDVEEILRTGEAEFLFFFFKVHVSIFVQGRMFYIIVVVRRMEKKHTRHDVEELSTPSFVRLGQGDNAIPWTKKTNKQSPPER